jgi:hypothetical protein
MSVLRFAENKDNYVNLNADNTFNMTSFVTAIN